MATMSRLLTVTQGNINNNHLYLHRVLSLFPADTLGGARSAEAAKRCVRVLYGNLTIETDIDRTKNIFRKRGWLARFFKDNRVCPGDQVLLEQLDPYLYRLSKAVGQPERPTPIPAVDGRKAIDRCAAKSAPVADTRAPAPAASTAGLRLHDRIVERDRFTCQSCGKRTRGQVHHILPRGQGGPDIEANLVTLCGRCHMLVSPIPTEVLCGVLSITVSQLLVQKAKVEVAIHSWVLAHAEPSHPASSTPVQSPSPRQSFAAASPRAVPDWKRLRPRSGKVWTRDEDRCLLQDFAAGLPLEEIARRRQRGIHAIAVRLCKLGVDWSTRPAAEQALHPALPRASP